MGPAVGQKSPTIEVEDISTATVMSLLARSGTCVTRYRPKEIYYRSKSALISRIPVVRVLVYHDMYILAYLQTLVT